jgi:uncharacterized peroxidase-related enzyme
MTKNRLDYYKISPDGINKLSAVSSYVHSSSLDAKLRALVELRVSQINGCLYCIDMHTKEARKLNEDQKKLDTLVAWHESPLFTDKEKTALAWAESLTHVSQTHAPDDVYAKLAEHFSEKEIVDLSLCISLMNAWNRIAIGFRKNPD